MDQKWMKKMDKFFTDFFTKKLPSLPKKAKDWLVKTIPYLALIFGVLAIPGLLAAAGFGAMTAPFWAFRGIRSLGYTLGFLLSCVQVVMQLMAVSPLFKRAKRGWQLLYYSSLLSIIGSIINTSVAGLVMVGVSLYLLYQIKANYK